MKGVIRGHGDKTCYLIDGKEVTKAEFDKHFPDKPLHGCAGLIGWKAMESEALAVHPDLVQAAREDAIKKGVPTDFNPETGAPIFRTRQHRAEYCKRYGFFDRSGGYGDAQRGQSDAKDRDRGTRESFDDDLPRNVGVAQLSQLDEQQRRRLAQEQIRRRHGK